MTPLSLYVPSVVSSKQHAILLVQVQESHAKGAQVSFSLKEIFGGHRPTPVIKSLKDAGIVVQIKASWPATATIQRHLGSCLSLIFNVICVELFVSNPRNQNILINPSRITACAAKVVISKIIEF